MEDMDEPATFWLDAHYQSGEQPSDTFTPLMDEIRAIGQHHIKTHMIMIDDVRLFHKYKTSVDEVTEALLAVNEDYKIKLQEGHKGMLDVLVAFV